MPVSVMDFVGTGKPKPNRKLKRPLVADGSGDASGVVRDSGKSRRVRGGKGSEHSKGRGRGRRRGSKRGPVVESLQRVGAFFWPERFPELARERAGRRFSNSAPRGFIWVWGVAVTLAAAAFVMHLYVRFEIIQTGYSLSNTQAEQRRLRLSQRELRLELATLKEPGRIEEQARSLLGMERPDHNRIVRLDKNSRRRRRNTKRRR